MHKRTQRNDEAGVALLSAILILMLMSALLVGFIASINSVPLSRWIPNQSHPA